MYEYRIISENHKDDFNAQLNELSKIGWRPMSDTFKVTAAQDIFSFKIFSVMLQRTLPYPPTSMADVPGN